MRRAYPLHPEVLKRISGDWSVLDKFQRTRGILKIMANAVYSLWSAESSAVLITPALLPFRDSKVRTALLEPLDRAYGPILQTEVDGEQSLAARIEARRPRFARARAATMAARAVFFATAPHGGAARGAITGMDLRLACAQPGDQIAIFGEALQEIASGSAHLYRDGERYWYSPQPTLNKLAADRARDVSDESADQRVVEILREEQRERAGFARVHSAPDNATDIDDRRSVALVILPPAHTHEAGVGQQSAAARLAAETIERRGTGQRRYRNVLIFVAADSSSVGAVRENARRELAWQSILRDEDLAESLTKAQASDAEAQARRSREALLQSVRRAWVHVLYPVPPGDGDGGERSGRGFVMEWARLVNRSGQFRITEAVWKKVTGDGTVIEKLGPGNLENSLEPIWPSGQPHISVEDARDWFASYVYMLRLRDDATLDGAIRRVAESLSARYAYAAAFDADTATYDGLVEGNGQLASVTGSGLLVRREIIPRKEPEKEELDRNGGTTTVPAGLGKDPENQDPGEKSPQRFFATIPVNTEDAGLDVARIMDGLLVELTRTPGSNLKLTLELEGTSPELGYPKDVVDTVKANARDLKLDPAGFGFEED